MKTKMILALLKEIEDIAKFQQKRFVDKKAVNRALVLRGGVGFIENYCFQIQDILSKYKLGGER